MKALFDYQAFELQKIGGVSRSYAEIISHLREYGCDCPISIRESDNVYLKEKELVESLRPLNYSSNRYFSGRKLFKGQRMLTSFVFKLCGYSSGGRHFNQDWAIKDLKRMNFEVFEPTFFDSYFLPYLKNKPFVITVHDMIPELFPQYFAKDDFQIVQKRLLCPLAAHIHVPSNRTKEDLVSILNVDPSKVTVIPHGGPQVDESIDIYNKVFDFPYLLYVGDRLGYKNFFPLLQSFRRIVDNDPGINLVCTGKSFNNYEISIIHDLHLDNNVVHHFATQNSFGSLYHNAIAFVYPSEYEGFGLPILEAFAYGCPVMLNEASCFPEVGGDAAIYFNIKNDSDFFEKFNYLYSMSLQDREELIMRGKRRLKLFSWESAAKSLFDIYTGLI